MSHQIPTEGGFFPSPNQRRLILKAIDHLMSGDCDCVDNYDIEAGFEVIDILREIELLPTSELEDWAALWNVKGEVE